MSLPMDEVVPGFLAELGDFEQLVRSLEPEDLRRPSRCSGWTAGDVAAHVIGQLADVTAGRFDGLGSPEVTERQVDERRGRTPAELADELASGTKAAVDLLAVFDDAAWAGPSPAGAGTLGDGVEALWCDAYLHADDIRDAVDRPSVPGPGTKASLSHVAVILTDQSWRPATLAFAGLGEYPVSGGGDPVSGDAHQFVLVATGRADPSAFGLDETVNIYR
jgi:uncharacterized protein (TIGR03083 family)